MPFIACTHALLKFTASAGEVIEYVIEYDTP